MLRRPDIILYEAIIEKGLFVKDALQPVLTQAEESGRPLQELLIQHGMVSEKDILRIIAEKLKLAYVNLRGLAIKNSVIEKVPVKVAMYYTFMPTKIDDRILTIAVPSVPDIKMLDEIRTQLGYGIEIVLACRDEISESIRKHYGLVADTLEKITSQGAGMETNLREEARAKVDDIEKLEDDASVMKLVNQIILEAYRRRATDIHIEPYRGEVAVRYRIDGMLYDANVPPEIKNFLSAIISRIKIMSNLNIVERRLPQDGRAVVRVQEQVLDLRISTIPTPYGESLVIRILPTKMLLSLEKLGLPKAYLEIFARLIQKPHGIIFVTGPTGSGKTTTLYSCLHKINSKERKIITIEDPIEYEMSGVTQIQVMPEIGLDFARGLRSILRHDPDIIMVGEVRDLETAQIAIRVALTGHLVFSTLHTNDASSGITRLIDIGVEPYLVASSVEAFIAQRLIRVICPECKYEDDAAPVELKELIAKDLKMQSIRDVKIYRGKGCPNCNFTGFFSRTAIYEILLVEPAIRDLIVKKTSTSRIKKTAMSAGMLTLRQDGWQRVISGVTTPEEVMKVTSSEEDTETGNESAVSTPDFESQSVSGSAAPERRSFIRLNNKTNIKYKIFKSEDEAAKKDFTAEQFSFTRDISAGGLLFISPATIAVGAIVELTIKLPDNEEPVECLARVVRIEETGEKNSYDIAVCFLDITSAERSRLNSYVEKEKK
jgi:type II secretory ATPase GspE/PulE/Tfp pilus assembly ATPase PilB-like protein